MCAAPDDPAPRRPVIAYTSEGGGVVATCKDCGWLTWTPDRGATRATARGHKCRGKR